MEVSIASAQRAPLSISVFGWAAPELARRLIGVIVLVDGVGGQVVETEAYDHQDPASHSFGGQTRRNTAMFGPPGQAYVYRSYGLHWCLNLVCGTVPGSAVLIRALQPEHGLDAMRARRGAVRDRDLCRGPGRLCRALGVTGALDGSPLAAPPFALLDREDVPDIAVGRRIGITRGIDAPWRFGLAGSRFLSRPMTG
ncbi:DNA-3-methyladenine glycosylase [Lichenicola sp.]|uniref:DNA-3-methyladenine glycosylase n=1 Tax=Lichenicola sp. TaxID=2804529 RepID=UPI003B00B0B1